MANEVTVSFLFVQCIDSVGTVDAHVFSCSCIRFSASQSPRIWCATVREICFCEKCPADGALSFARRHLPDARSETSAVQDAEDQDQCCQLHDASAILSFRTWAYSDRVLSKSRMQAWHRQARRTNMQRILVRLWCDIFLSELPLATQRTARDRWNQEGYQEHVLCSCSARFEFPWRHRRSSARMRWSPVPSFFQIGVTKATSKRRIASSSSECDGARPKKTAALCAAKKISLFSGLGRPRKFAS